MLFSPFSCFDLLNLFFILFLLASLYIKEKLFFHVLTEMVRIKYNNVLAKIITFFPVYNIKLFHNNVKRQWKLQYFRHYTSAALFEIMHEDDLCLHP